jgi:hypothetical protein
MSILFRFWYVLLGLPKVRKTLRHTTSLIKIIFYIKKLPSTSILVLLFLFSLSSIFEVLGHFTFTAPVPRGSRAQSPRASTHQKTSLDTTFFRTSGKLILILIYKIVPAPDTHSTSPPSHPPPPPPRPCRHG